MKQAPKALNLSIEEEAKPRTQIFLGHVVGVRFPEAAHSVRLWPVANSKSIKTDQVFLLVPAAKSHSRPSDRLLS
jgi:hypothetical protein